MFFTDTVWVFCLSTDLFICVEVDSYGHYFRKAKSKLVCNSANPRWNEQFIIELEGSQNLRILLYEESQDRAILRAKSTQKVKQLEQLSCLCEKNCYTFVLCLWLTVWFRLFLELVKKFLLLQNPKFYHCVNESPVLDPILKITECVSKRWKCGRHKKYVKILEGHLMERNILRK